MEPKDQNRRDFLGQLATVAGGVVLLPYVTACGTTGTTGTTTPAKVTPTAIAPGSSMLIPQTPPADWNAITFNQRRGNDGAIPESYWAAINGPEGAKKHLGKHLPYGPSFDAKLIPVGYVAIMWGDATKGYARHPTAAKNAAQSYKGHWYNWIKIRKAIAGDTEEVTNEYPDWPGPLPYDAKNYAVFGGGDITADGGRNTVYLVKLPTGVQKGDRVRIYAHCLYHGEYIDFLTL
ncbi:MAG: hypothetical protein JRH20_06600 [Deltaproteobacteria bacterium]|nr:hypothetical protein [Deltaproteobacteria bacterium]